VTPLLPQRLLAKTRKRPFPPAPLLFDLQVFSPLPLFARKSSRQFSRRLFRLMIAEYSSQKPSSPFFRFLSLGSPPEEASFFLLCHLKRILHSVEFSLPPFSFHRGLLSPRARCNSSQRSLLPYFFELPTHGTSSSFPSQNPQSHDPPRREVFSKVRCISSRRQ